MASSSLSSSSCIIVSSSRGTVLLLLRHILLLRQQQASTIGFAVDVLIRVFLVIVLLMTMLCGTRTTVVADAAANSHQQEQELLWLSKEFLDLSIAAGELSDLTLTATSNRGGSSDEQQQSSTTKYDFFQVFQNEPDLAVVAAYGNRCYVAFRGTLRTIPDWWQNINPFYENICRHHHHHHIISNDESNSNSDETTTTTTTEVCCKVRAGLYDAYLAPYLPSLEAAIDECIAHHTPCRGRNSSSDNDNNNITTRMATSSSSGSSRAKNRTTTGTTTMSSSSCLVLTGHSQGGAAATIASIIFDNDADDTSYQPIVVTFGQPTTIHDATKCELLTASSDRLYRFVNTKAIGWGSGWLLGYDLVPMAFSWRASHAGHMVLLPPARNSNNINNSSQWAYLGLDIPDWRNWPLVVAHDLTIPGSTMGYLEHLRWLRETTSTYPVRVHGFAEHTLCSQDRECQPGHACRSPFYKWPLLRHFFKRCIVS